MSVQRKPKFDSSGCAYFPSAHMDACDMASRLALSPKLFLHHSSKNMKSSKANSKSVSLLFSEFSNLSFSSIRSPLISIMSVERRHSSQAVCSSIRNPAVTGKPSSLIRKLEKQISSRERSAVEVTQEYLDRISAVEPMVQSFLHIASENAIKQASDIDARLSNGEKLSPLAGVPISLKDNLCTYDMPSTGGSRILQSYRPPYDATAVGKLRSSGVVFVGKTNMDEFGMGSTTEGSGFKPSSNPWDLSRVPGGSSGGSAASVSSGQCIGSLGSDTGGSVRQPGSFTGTVGLKPTYGRVSRYGLMSYASSLDVIGCLTSCVEDAAILLGGIAGNDDKDATCSSKQVDNYLQLIEPCEKFSSKPLLGARFGLIMETMGEGVDTDVLESIRKAALQLEELGAEVEEVSLPSFKFGLPAYYVLAPSEASSNLARLDGIRFGPQSETSDLSSLFSVNRGTGFGAEVKRRILTGTYALSAGYYDAYYKRAQKVRTLIQRDFSSALQRFDALLSPTCPTTAFLKGEKISDPLALYAGDLMTVNVNLAGLPAISIPCGLANKGHQGLPIGLQMIGRAFGEAELLKLAHIFEQTTELWPASFPVVSVTQE